MKDATLSSLFSKIHTGIEAQSLIDDIDILLNSTFRIETDSLQQSLLTKIGGTDAKIISDALIAEEITVIDKDGARKILTEIKKELGNITDTTIFLSFEPTLGIIEAVSKWIKANLGQRAIIHFKQDASILGGAVIVHKGIYKDYSLKRKLGQLITSNKDLYKKYL